MTSGKAPSAALLEGVPTHPQPGDEKSSPPLPGIGTRSEEDGDHHGTPQDQEEDDADQHSLIPSQSNPQIP